MIMNTAFHWIAVALLIKSAGNTLYSYIYYDFTQQRKETKGLHTKMSVQMYVHELNFKENYIHEQFW